MTGRAERLGSPVGTHARPDRPRAQPGAARRRAVRRRASPPCSSRSPCSRGRSAGCSSSTRTRSSRVLGVVVIVLGLGVPGARPVPAEREARAPRAARRPVGCAAAGRHVRARLGAVHRPDARRDPHALARRRLGRPRRACSRSRSASASGCRSCSSRSASSAAPRRSAFLRRHRLAIMRLGGGMLVSSASRWSPACGAPGRPGCRVSSSAATRSCRWCDVSVHRPEGLSDVFMDPTEAPAPTPPTLPTLGFVGWLRWAWRQLTSMRVALLLLMLLAVAAVPGHRVAAARAGHREGRHLPRPTTRPPARGSTGSAFFNVYSSVWFSRDLPPAVRLAGRLHPAAHQGAPRRACAAARRARPAGSGGSPRRASGRRRRDPRSARPATPQTVLRGGWRWLPFVPTYRVDTRDEGGGTWSVSGERGYLRETGNLVFHLALVGLLISVATGQVLHYRGQAIVVQGRGSPTRRSTTTRSSRAPRTRRRASSRSRCGSTTSSPASTRTRSQSRDFTAHVTLTEPGRGAGGRRPSRSTTRSTPAAPRSTCRATATRRTSRSTTPPARSPFSAADAVPAAGQRLHVARRAQGPRRLRRPGADRPRRLPAADRAARSATDLLPLRVPRSRTTRCSSCTVWQGNLGLDTGVPQNVYELDEARHDAGRRRRRQAAITLYVQPGETVDLPDGLGTLTFNGLPAVRRARPAPRPRAAVRARVRAARVRRARHLAVRAAPARLAPVRAGRGRATTGRTVVTAAGLARGDDVGLQPELDRVLAATLARDDDPGAPAARPQERARHEHR